MQYILIFPWGKSQYILIFPGGKLSIYSFFRGEKWVWGKNEYVTPVLDSICLSQWFIMLCLLVCCISITKKIDMSVAVIYHAMSLSMLYQYHSERWYFCHSGLPCYVCDSAVSVSLRRVFFLSQWFIMLGLLVCCISITQKSDISDTVVYHAVSLTLLCQYH